MTFKARPKDVWKEEHSRGGVGRGGQEGEGWGGQSETDVPSLEARKREWLGKGSLNYTEGISQKIPPSPFLCSSSHSQPV